MWKIKWFKFYIIKKCNYFYRSIGTAWFIDIKFLPGDLILMKDCLFFESSTDISILILETSKISLCNP
jgi:hypothetical protein